MVYEHSKKYINSLFSARLPEDICSLIYFYARSKLDNTIKNTTLYKFKYKFNRNDKHIELFWDTI